MSLAPPEKKKLLTRIHRAARTAALHRLRGNMNAAMEWDRRVDAYASHAERHQLGSAAGAAEERGREAGEKLHRKTGLFKKRGYDPSRRKSATHRRARVHPRARARRSDPSKGSSFPATLQKTHTLRNRVPLPMLPLFDHLLVLAQDAHARGRAASAGQDLRKARQLAGESAPMRRPALSSKMDRRRLGLLMQNWHGSMGDPIYAVGSFYFDNQPYPQKSVVESALSGVDAMLPQALRRQHGWGPREAGELRVIARGLRYFLRVDYAGARSDPRRRKRSRR